MSGKNDKRRYMICSFCGKDQNDVQKLIAGFNVTICDECIGLCNDILEDEEHKDEALKYSTEPLPTPKEIKKALDELKRQLGEKVIDVEPDRVELLEADQDGAIQH